MGNNNKKRFFKFTFAVTATTVLEKVIFFSLTVIIAQYLSVNDYGIYTTALGYATFFLAFSDIGLNVTLIRAINLDQDNENENVSTVVFVKTILLLFVFGIMVFSLYFTSHTGDVVYLIFLFGLVRVGSEYQNTFYSMFEAKEKFLILSFFKSTFAVTLLGGTFLVIVYKGGYFEFAYIRVAIIVGYLLWMSVSILKRFKFKFAFNLSIIKSFLANTVPFAVSTIFAIVIFQLGIVILPLMHDSSLVGIYSNGQLFLLTLYFIPAIYGRMLSPFLYKRSYEDHSETFQFTFDVYSKLLMIIGFFAFLVFFLFAPNIISLLFGEKYIETVMILKIVSFGVFFIFTISGSIITTLDLQNIRAKYEIYAMIIALAANLVLIKLYKGEGAAMALVIGLASQFFFFHYFLIKNKYVKVYNTFVLFVKLSVITVLACVLFELYLAGLFFVYSALIITAFYGLSLLFFIVTKDDFRIFKEIFTSK